MISPATDDGRQVLPRCFFPVAVRRMVRTASLLPRPRQAGVPLGDHVGRFLRGLAARFHSTTSLRGGGERFVPLARGQTTVVVQSAQVGRASSVRVVLSLADHPGNPGDAPRYDFENHRDVARSTRIGLRHLHGQQRRAHPLLLQVCALRSLPWRGSVRFSSDDGPTLAFNGCADQRALLCLRLAGEGKESSLWTL